MAVERVKLEKFDKENYADLISWIDSEEALMQFAGPLFRFPLTSGQLDISLSDKNRIAFRVVDNETDLAVGHAEIYLSETSAKIGRILIGAKEHRDKGLGQQVVALLLNFAFSNFNVTIIELNVFDWNIGAIKCYEKAGFTINPEKTVERKIKNETWTAVNMTIHRTYNSSTLVK